MNTKTLATMALRGAAEYDSHLCSALEQLQSMTNLLAQGECDTHTILTESERLFIRQYIADVCDIEHHITEHGLDSAMAHYCK